MIRLLGTMLAALLLFVAPAAAQPARDDFGVLVMAHGGGTAWNAQVETMLEPVRRDHNLEIAFGMASPDTIQAAVRRLEQRGARRIAVVRLFVSGESWRERTEQILGLRPGAPPRPQSDAHAGHGGSGHDGHDMSLWRIESSARFALSNEGLMNAREMGAVLVERVRPLSRDPRRETVLVLAHGPEDDAENERWIREIDARTQMLRDHAPFRRVVVETLREDWPERRAASEARIRALAAEAARDGGQLIVLPYRVTGFGPYARVLEGITYTADRQGLLPSPQVEQWVRRQAEALRPTLTAAAN
jgi:sirohydrochlorin cobaltochelatase